MIRVRSIGFEGHCRQVPHVTWLWLAQLWATDPSAGMESVQMFTILRDIRSDDLIFSSAMSFPWTSLLPSRSAGRAPGLYCLWMPSILQAAFSKWANHKNFWGACYIWVSPDPSPEDSNSWVLGWISMACILKSALGQSYGQGHLGNLGYLRFSWGTLRCAYFPRPPKMRFNRSRLRPRNQHSQPLCHTLQVNLLQVILLLHF